MPQEITLIGVKKEHQKDINKQLQWLAKSLGLFGERDKDKSCFRVFISLLKYSSTEKPLSSDQLASLTNLTRGTVVHHLHRLENAGLIIREKRGYLPRETSISKIIYQIRKDILALFRDLEKTAQRIDRTFKKEKVLE